MSQFRLWTQDGDAQHIGHSQVISVEEAADDVGLFSLDEIFYSFDRLGTVHQVSSQAHMMLLGRGGGETISLLLKGVPFLVHMLHL